MTGQPIGTFCTELGDDAGANACRGTCVGVTHSEGQLPFTLVCTESCTLGAVPSCEWSGPGTGPAPATCLHGGVEIGDRGSCGQLCDDNCGCSNPDLVCTPWTGADAQALKDLFQRNGYCADPLAPDGGPDPGIPCGVDASID